MEEEIFLKQDRSLGSLTSFLTLLVMLAVVIKWHQHLISIPNCTLKYFCNSNKLFRASRLVLLGRWLEGWLTAYQVHKFLKIKSHLSLLVLIILNLVLLKNRRGLHFQMQQIIVNKMEEVRMVERIIMPIITINA